MCYFYLFTECTYRHHVELDGQFLSLDVLDTAGKVVTVSRFYDEDFFELNWQ